MQQECNTDSTHPPSLSPAALFKLSRPLIHHLHFYSSSSSSPPGHTFFFFSIVPIPLLKIPFSPPLSLNQISVSGHFLTFISAFLSSLLPVTKCCSFLKYFVLSRVLFYLIKNRFCFSDTMPYPGSIYDLDTFWYILQYDDSLNKHLKWGMLENTNPTQVQVKFSEETWCPQMRHGGFGPMLVC